MSSFMFTLLSWHSTTKGGGYLTALVYASVTAVGTEMAPIVSEEYLYYVYNEPNILYTN